MIKPNINVSSPCGGIEGSMEQIPEITKIAALEKLPPFSARNGTVAPYNDLIATWGLKRLSGVGPALSLFVW